jgi:hypothetical protein
MSKTGTPKQPGSDGSATPQGPKTLQLRRLRIKSHIQAGGDGPATHNHNQAVLRPR